LAALRGQLFMTLGAASLVINDAIVKTLTTQMPPSQIIAIRSVVIALICLGLMRLKGQSPRVVLDRDTLIRTGFTIGNVFAFVAAISVLPFSIAVLVDYTNILFVAMAAPFVLGEQLSPLRVFAVLAGLFGAALILSPEFSVSGAAILLPLLSGVLGAGRELWTRKLRSYRISAEELTLFAALGTLIIAPIIGIGTWHMPATRDIALAALAGGFQGLALILMAQALFSSEASAVAPFRLTALIWALLLAYLFFGDQTSVTQAIGTGGILVALVLSTFESGRLHRARTARVTDDLKDPK